MKNVLPLLLFLGLGACVPVSLDYYYLSLAEVEDVVVLETGRSTMKGFFHRPMPIKYRLARRSYVVDFEIDRGHHHPNFWITAKTESGKGLRIESIDGSDCSRWGNGSSELRTESQYSVVNFRSRTCKPIENPALRGVVIAFNVIGANGEVLGIEQLPAKVVRNGTVFYYDAI